MDLLVVDDESSILSLCRRGINPEEMTVHTAASGKEALEILAAKKIDILLTDLVMEPINGLALTKQVRKQYPEVDILIMTGYPTIDTVVNALRQGAYDYIIKPLDLVMMKAAIRRCVERRTLRAVIKTIGAASSEAYKRLDELAKQIDKLKPGQDAGTFEVEHAAARGLADVALKELFRAQRSLEDVPPRFAPETPKPAPEAGSAPKQA